MWHNLIIYCTRMMLTFFSKNIETQIKNDYLIRWKLFWKLKVQVVSRFQFCYNLNTSCINLSLFYKFHCVCVCRCLVSSSRHYLEGASVKPAEGGFHGVGPGDAEVPPDRHARRALPLSLHAERARAQCECGWNSMH